MADTNRQPKKPVEARPAGSIGSAEFFNDFSNDVIYYNFFSALRLLESKGDSRFGESKTPKEDPLLLGQSAHIDFAPTALAELRDSENTPHKWLDIYFFGLFGPNGALPFHLSEQVYTKLPKEERKHTRDFFNMFHHGLISLFYRAWANKEPTAQLDGGKSDKFQLYVGALAGYGLPSLKNRDTLSDYSKAHFAAYFGGKTRHREGLQNIIHQLYDMKSNIIEFIGEWLSIPIEHQCKLKEKHYAKQLGKNTTLGKHSWQAQYKFQIQLGPLSLNEYESCLPGSKKLKQINETIKNYMRDEIQWEIILLLKKTEIPSTRIGQYGQLGWTSWLTLNKSSRNAQECEQFKNEYIDDIRLHCEQI